MRSLPKPRREPRYSPAYQRRIEALNDATRLATAIVASPKAQFSDNHLERQLRFAQTQIGVLLSWLGKKDLSV